MNKSTLRFLVYGFASSNPFPKVELRQPKADPRRPQMVPTTVHRRKRRSSRHGGWVSRALQGPPKRFKTAQDGSMTAQNDHKTAPRLPKTAPRRPRGGLDSAIPLVGPSFVLEGQAWKKSRCPSRALFRARGPAPFSPVGL